MSSTKKQLFNRRVYPAGAKIFAEGDSGSTMYYVERGKVEISRGHGEHKLVLGYIEQSGIFGEMALIDAKPRMANATAVSVTVLLMIPEQAFRQKIKGCDPFIVALIRMLVGTLRGVTQELQALKIASADFGDAPHAAEISANRVSVATTTNTAVAARVQQRRS
jgi:CRP-like cAMP-binding protein